MPQLSATARPDERWSLRDLAPAERAEGWRDVVARTHLEWSVGAPPVETGRPFDAAVRRRRYADVDVLDCRCDPCAGGRGRTELRTAPSEHVGVLAVLGGREVLEQDGRRVELRAGDAVLWDSTRPASFAVVAPLRKRTLLLPRAALAGAGDPAGWTVRLLPRGSVAVGLLAAHLHALDRHPVSTDEDARLVARITADLVAACAAALVHGADPDGADPAGPDPRGGTLERRAALRRAVELWLDRRLAAVERGAPLRPDELSPRAVAAAHAVSVRGLHQLYEDAPETLARRVLRLRLERARRQLADGGGTVTGVAARWGFADASHFARAYRRQFGEAPRDTAAGARLRPDREG